MRTPATDREDRFELPTALRKLVIPRDRLPAGSPAPELDPVLVEEAVAARHLALGRAGHVMEVAIADPAADRVLVAAARDEDLGDIQGLTPVGAAVAASFADRFLADFLAGGTIDMWVSVRGLPFAVAAFCVYARLDGALYENRHLRPLSRPRLNVHKTKALLRLLEHIRAASDEEYAACVAAVGEPREQDASGMVRWISLFLFPDREDWRTADLPALRRHIPAADTGLVLSVLGADATAALLALYDDYEEVNRDRDYMIHSAQELEHILRLVSWLPRDEAMQARCRR